MGHWVWCLVIGALIVLWIAVGVTDLGWINKLTMAALFLLTLVLCKVIFFSGNAVTAAGEAMSFGAAVELAVAMADVVMHPYLHFQNFFLPHNVGHIVI